MRRGARVTALDYSAADLKDVAAVAGAMIEAGEVDVRPVGRRRRTATRSTCRSPTTRFDRVIVSEVLEHIWDDERALAEIVRVLRPGGRVAATVPTRWPERVSWALNWRYHDTPGGHVRIYRQHELELKIERAGLLPARFAPRARVPLAVLVAEVRVRARQHRRRAGASGTTTSSACSSSTTRAGRASPNGRSTRCSARASCCTARRSPPTMAKWGKRSLG